MHRATIITSSLAEAVSLAPFVTSARADDDVLRQAERFFNHRALIATPTSVAAWIRCASKRLRETGIATIAIKMGTAMSGIAGLTTVATCKPGVRRRPDRLFGDNHM